MRRISVAILFALFFTLPVMAGEKTKAPTKLDFLVGPKITYMDQLGAGVQFALHDKSRNVLYLLDISAVRINAVSGSTTEDDGSAPPPGDVDPFHVDSRTKGQIGFAVLFRPGAPK
jgi:hypothetical protein